MDNQTKIILGLLILIAILVGIFALKITGVIKPVKKVELEETQEIEEVKESFIIKLISFVMTYIIAITIVMFIINMILAIGEAKLYRKIGMPDWTISFEYIYPVTNLILGFVHGTVANIISGVMGLLSILCLCKFLECLEVPKWWLLSLTAGLILAVIGIIKSGINILLIMGIILILAYFYAHVIASIRLARKFDKGILFTVLLIILPGIFQPVLGFQDN